MQTTPWHDTTFIAWLRADPALLALHDFAATLLDDDPGHDLAHALRVAHQAASLGLAEGADPREAVAAALFHDVVNLPKDHPDRAKASTLSAERARACLPAFGFDAAAIDRIADAIRDHSFSRGAVPTNPLGRALQDADRLEALGVIGLFRCISTGVRMGARYFDAADPFARSRPRDDLRFSIDHFYTKLLKLPATFLTAAGRAEAQRRAAWLETALVQLADELGEGPPPSVV
jgi:uncharacterized protein